MTCLVPAAAPRPLPAWPVVGLLGGIGVWWATGLIAFVPTVAAVVMVVIMLLRGARFLPGLGPWLCLLAWVVAAAVTAAGSGAVLGYGLRLLDVADAAVIGVYVASATQTLTRRRIVATLSAVWLSMVILGLASQLFPNARLSTPVGSVMPASLMSNDLVRDLVTPRLAEVQQPWGAEEPFNRTAAPFPYANSWGQAYALLTPVVVAWTGMIGRTRWRVTWCLLLVVSVYPALATSNRAMLVALAVSTLVAAFMMGRLGRPALSLAVCGGFVVVAVSLYLAGAGEALSARTSTSSSTQDRLELYRRTLERVGESPLLGHGAPRLDPVVGVSFGTQGMVWLLLYCFGVPALLFYLWFVLGVLVRGARVPDPAGAWLYSGVAVLPVVSPVYALSSFTMLIAMVLAVTVLRQARVPDRPVHVVVPSLGAAHGTTSGTGVRPGRRRDGAWASSR